MKYRFITIEGNIGAGKTTLSTKLAESYNAKLILESFADNPFLPKFYSDPDKHAFAVELFFMAERYKQIQDLIKEQDLFHSTYISDYLFYKSLIFAGVTLNDDERKLYNRLFHIINKSLPQPDMIIYLHNRIETLLNNIRKRGRSFEQSIQSDYLKKLEENYFAYLKNVQNTVVIILETDHLNFIDNQNDMNKVKDLLNEELTVGLYYIK